MSRVDQITVNGVNLTYQVYGAPGNPPVVLLHALGERGSNWEPVTGLFAELLQVFTLDLRGHGDSDRTAAYSFDAMCDDVVGLLHELGLRRVALIGHSMGGVWPYAIPSS